MLRPQPTKLNNIARKYTRMAVSGRREDAVRMLAFGVSMLEQAMLIGADMDRVTDMAELLHDTMSNICGRMHRDMDDQGLGWEYQPIDMTDLDLVLARLPRKPSVPA